MKQKNEESFSSDFLSSHIFIILFVLFLNFAFAFAFAFAKLKRIVKHLVLVQIFCMIQLLRVH